MSWNWLDRTDPFELNELGPWMQYNPAKARELLAEAGLPDGFELEYMVSGSPASLDVLVQQFLEQVGVQVKFDQRETVVVNAARSNRTFKHAIRNASPREWTPIKVVRDWFLPESPGNAGRIDDPVMTDLVERATYALDADEQLRLLRQINDRSLDQCYFLERYAGFLMFVRQPWLQNVASRTQGSPIASGISQTAIAWVNDAAPAERRGRLRV